MSRLVVSSQSRDYHIGATLYESVGYTIPLIRVFRSHTLSLPSLSLSLSLPLLCHLTKEIVHFLYSKHVSLSTSLPISLPCLLSLLRRPLKLSERTREPIGCALPCPPPPCSPSFSSLVRAAKEIRKSLARGARYGCVAGEGQKLVGEFGFLF